MGFVRGFAFAFCAACCVACSNSTSPEPVAAKEIDQLFVFVRDWPNEYVEIDFKRTGGQSRLLMYRPPQPGIPRVLLDSIGPSADDPPEIVQLLQDFNVWALADSNAVGAACNTKQGGWVCNPTFEDYSLVMQVTRRGQTRSQRYTSLERSTSNRTARALGDFVFAWSRKRAMSSESSAAMRTEDNL